MMLGYGLVTWGHFHHQTLWKKHIHGWTLTMQHVDAHRMRGFPTAAG